MFFPFSKQFSIRRPPLLKTPTPLERESLPQEPPKGFKNPLKRGIPGFARARNEKCDFLVPQSMVLGALHFSKKASSKGMEKTPRTASEPLWAPPGQFLGFFWAPPGQFLGVFGLLPTVSRFFGLLGSFLGAPKGHRTPATFSRLNFGQGGVVFFHSQSNLVFGDPSCSKLRPPLERESLPPKTPHMRGGGTQDRPGSQLKKRFFSTEIDGSGWALVFWIFGPNRAFTGLDPKS